MMKKNDYFKISDIDIFKLYDLKTIVRSLITDLDCEIQLIKPSQAMSYTLDDMYEKRKEYASIMRVINQEIDSRLKSIELA